MLAEIFAVDRLSRLAGPTYTTAGIGTLIGPLAAGILHRRLDTYRRAIPGCFVLATAAVLALLPLKATQAGGAGRVGQERVSRLRSRCSSPTE